MARLRLVFGTFLSAFADYKWTAFRLRSSTDAVKEAATLALDEKWAPRMLDTILAVRGAYVKIGQVLLTRPDVLQSATYRRVLEPLLDSVPPIPFEEIEAIVCRSLGLGSLNEAFAEFGREPLGTASIAQVHAARLKSGEDVVVKVRLPSAAADFDLDLRSMRGFTRLTAPEMMPAIKEIQGMVARELDFRNEAASMRTIGDAVRASGRFPEVVVPVPVGELCTDEVVVMTRLRGDKLYARVLDHYESFARNMGMTLDELKAKMAEKALVAAARTYLHEMVGWWLPTFLANIWRKITGMEALAYPPPPLPTNHLKLFDTVCRVHGFQVLNVGTFNGDAHAGNIFLLDDGRIGLLDFGACRTLNPTERRNLASNILLLCEREHDVAKIAARTKALGFVSEKNLDYTAYMWAQILFGRDDPSVLVGLDGERFPDMATFQDYLMKVDKTQLFPKQFFLAARLALLMRGLALLLGLPGQSVAEYWKEEAEIALEGDLKEVGGSR
ncbi:ABC1 family-domain-containing protein [Hyaloraphidium curvatum]|nr:ABC1 family-domain-containing protein [Hyaloraphidium curvatum]